MENEERYGAFLQTRAALIRERMAEALARAGRAGDDIVLAAVSKTVGTDEVKLAWQAGYRVFAENRPQELRRKLDALAADPDLSGARFDMIGNLQANKTNMVVGRATLIQSISSTELAETVSKRSCARGLVSPVLLEANVSGERSKSGFSPEGLVRAFDALMELPGIRIDGLMGMAPRHDPDAARRSFSGLRELADDLRRRSALELPVLSCGMSDDFPIALEEGSTLVRLGRVVFSPEYELK